MKEFEDVDYANSAISAIIDEYIHHDKYRDILKMRFIDHATYERIAEAVEMSDKQVARIVKKYRWTVFKHL